MTRLNDLCAGATKSADECAKLNLSGREEQARAARESS
jgi:hypothetical protein